MSRLRLCVAAEIAPGEMRRVERPDGDALAVYNIDGHFHVTADTCTHARASLTEGDLEGDTVICPAHEGAFHVPTGRALCFPVTRDLETYSITVEDGVIYADAARPSEEAAA
jgi:nitrite reductase/ring-hydroxylating ferredoxin subunit